MYTTTSVLTSSEGLRLVVFGGRKGPSRGCSTALVLGGSEVRQFTLGHGEGRWRHSATPVEIEGRCVLVVVGGRTASGICSLEKVWALDLEQGWLRIAVQRPPRARHSHGACALGSAVLICGGLGEDEQLLEDSAELHLRASGSGLEGEWRTATSLPRARFGHAVHHVAGRRVVVGGVDGTCATPPLLVDGQAVFTAQSDSDPFMWHNCASCVLGDSMLVLGGGGNHFSFGTHLNASARRIPIADLLST